MSKKKASGGKTKSGAKNSLVGNINRRKKAGKSRSKKNSTISKESYDAMEKGWPKKGAKKAARKKSPGKKAAKKKASRKSS